MRAWDYTDIYVAACLRPFNTHSEGREHERDCPECQRIIRGESDEVEEDDSELPAVGRVEPHPQGGWQVVFSNADEDVQFVGCDGRGLSREMAESVLKRLNDFIAAMS